MTPSFARMPRVKKYQGENGVTVLQQDNPTSRSFCMGVWINTGSRDEPTGEEGLCHFFEHMVFKGTATRSSYDISQTIEKIGGALEAFTTKEQICFYTQVLDNDKQIAADILSDLVQNPAFPNDQVELEQQVVLEEINDVLDAPDDLIHELFANEVFPNHPLGKSILGTPDSVSTFNRTALTRFARRHVRARNLVISIYGNIDKRRVMKLCDWAFQLKDGAIRRARPRIERYRPVKRVFKRKLHHQHICIGGRCCSYVDEQRYPLMVLTTLLGGTMSSRLFQRIRERLGYTYAIYTYSEAARDAGLVGTYFAVRPSNAQRVLSEVFKEFKDLRAGNISKEELDDTKAHLKGRILLGLETSTAKMMRNARNEIYFGRQISERELIERIDQVSMDDILELAADILDVGKNTIVSLGPSSSGLRPSFH
jgi:predicted Zn-dependent peptidase